MKTTEFYQAVMKSADTCGKGIEINAAVVSRVLSEAALVLDDMCYADALHTLNQWLTTARRKKNKKK